jgi:hypothetical protein
MKNKKEKELRGRIPTDLARQNGIAWYNLFGFGSYQPEAEEAYEEHDELQLSLDHPKEEKKEEGKSL